MNSRNNVTVLVKLKLPHPPKGLLPALDYLLSEGVLPYMLDYVTCVAGFEKGRGIGTEGKKGMSLGRDGPLFARFLPSSPCLPVSLSPCPSSVLRLPGRLWATWVCAAQQGMVFAPLALKQGMKITLLSLLSLPKNR